MFFLEEGTVDADGSNASRPTGAGSTRRKGRDLEMLAFSGIVNCPWKNMYSGFEAVAQESRLQVERSRLVPARKRRGSRATRLIQLMPREGS